MASTLLVRDIMSKDVKIVRPDTSAQEVVATLNKFRLNAVIVVQKEKPVGIITVHDVLNKVVEQCLAPRLLAAGEMMTSSDDDHKRGSYCGGSGETHGTEKREDTASDG
jgi:CBS domain-containing protein